MTDSNRLQRLQQTPLWDFACAFYARNGVAQACLTLQDEAGVDVCELLFHCWLYRHHLMAREAPLLLARDARNDWQARVTQPLRALRRELKPRALQSASIHPLRDTIKAAELAAEKENLNAWQAFALGDDAGEPVVIEVDEKPINLAFWLQDRLFSPSMAGSCKVALASNKSVENAWRTIASYLDPLIAAR